MRIFISILMIAATTGIASAREMARTTHGGIPTPRPAVSGAPTAPDAPSQGVITRVDLAAKTVSITGQDMQISQPLVAILDKRANATGLLKLPDLRVGMRVRYRAQDNSGALPRVVELWILSDAQPASSPSRSR